MRLIRTLIVDDERLARQRMRRLLSTEPDVEIAGECANARQAVELTRSVSPDLILLDIRMPGDNAFQMLEALGEGEAPVVIIVTAHEQYAVKAFEIGAQDYLLKPVQEARFHEALRRARESLNAASGRRNNAGKPRGPEVILVRSADRVSLLKIQDIDWIESADNYVRIHAGRDAHIVRETMATFAGKLEHFHFARIHRSTIVNIDRIEEIRPWFNGDFMTILKGGQQLRMSRTYRESVRDLLGNSV